MKVTYQDLLDSRIPQAIGACPLVTDLRLLGLTNEGLERLMYEGKWHNTIQRVRICAVDSCITVPPQVAVLEKVAICGMPVTLRSPWFEYIGGGYGIRGGSGNNGGTPDGSAGSCCGSAGGTGWCSGGEGLPRGYFPTFSDIVGVNKKVNLVCDLVTDVGKHALLLGYDNNGNWIRTSQSGTIQDGELVAFAQSAGTTSTNFFSSLTDIQFNEARDGQVWAYEFNNDTSIRRMIGQFQAFEDRPNYARYYFPQIRTGNTNTDSTCVQTLVEAMVKLNFWKVKVATDYLCIPNIPALKEMLQALNDAENEPDGVKKKQLIASGIASAREVLDKQLDHFTGAGYVPSFEILGSSVGSLDPVMTLI